MNRITIEAFAKVNLSIDVKGVLENGYHEVEMVMQQISLHDDVQIGWSEGKTDTESDHGVKIVLTTTRGDLPNDSGNLAYRAADLMASQFAPGPGTLTIHIDKHIPVAAGMAGGSSNCAAVLHGINQIWNLGMDVAAICVEAAKLGSDIPFCVMGQAAAADELRGIFANDPLAAHCALATGTGTQLQPIAGLDAFIALSKPPIAVSTPEVYRGIDEIIINERPDNDALILALKEQDNCEIYRNMVNVLENYTLKVYPIVMYTKDKIISLNPSGPTLMSGSGPTVFAICQSQEEADSIRDHMLVINEESYSVRTTY